MTSDWRDLYLLPADFSHRLLDSANPKVCRRDVARLRRLDRSTILPLGKLRQDRLHGTWRRPHWFALGL